MFLNAMADLPLVVTIETRPRHFSSKTKDSRYPGCPTLLSSIQSKTPDKWCKS